MHMPILRGRPFDSHDRAEHPRSVIIDDSFARRFFPGKDPIGQQIDDTTSDAKEPPPVMVVGVVPRTRNQAPGEDNSDKLNMVQLYYCLDEVAERGTTLLVRVKSGDPRALVPLIKRELHELDPDQAFADISTMENNIDKSLGSRRMMMSLLGAFALIALALASVGLYGVMALTVFASSSLTEWCWSAPDLSSVFSRPSAQGAACKACSTAWADSIRRR